MEEGKTVEKLGMSLDSLITRRTDTNKTQHRGGGWKPRKYEGGGGQREERRGGGGGAPHKYTTKYGGSKFVYISNLSYSTAWQDLKDHMRKAGEVLFAEVFTRNGDGRSIGCGVAEFENGEDAEKAIEMLNGSILQGREVEVRKDRRYGEEGGQIGRSQGMGSMNMRSRLKGGRERSRSRSKEREEEMEEGSGGYKGRESKGMRGGSVKYSFRSGGELGERQLFVGNLPFAVTWQQLKDVFRDYGAVERAFIPTNREGKSKGYGIVRFQSRKDALYAKDQLHDSQFNGRKIEIKFDENDYDE